MATRRHTSNELGFSLLELVIVIGMLSIIMGAAFSLMNRSQTNFDRNQLSIEARQNADFAITRISEIIRGAGANPAGASTINSINFISNTAADNTTSTNQVRILSDLNGNKLLTDRVSVSAGNNFFIISSEDLTLKHYASETSVNGVTVPARTIALIDNTPDVTGGDQINGKPIVLAQYILSFTCVYDPLTRNEATITVQAGPSRPISITDPRYVSFTRTMKIRLRNRNN